jgi:hypothetical protein
MRFSRDIRMEVVGIGNWQHNTFIYLSINQGGLTPRGPVLEEFCNDYRSADDFWMPPLLVSQSSAHKNGAWLLFG